MASNAPQPGFAFSGQARHRLSYGEIKQLAEAYGLPGDAIAQISEGESGRYADVQQRDPGDGMVGYGLLQMTPNAWGKNSAAYKHMQSLGGVAAMRDPAKNMAMARFLYKSAGNKLTPWYGTRFLTNRSGEGTLGPVDHSKLGGAGAQQGAPTQPAATQTTPGVDNSGLRAQAVQQFLGSKNADPVSFAMAIRGAQDVPGTTATAAATPAVGAPASSGGPTSKLVSRANAIDAKQLPYKWGGGHGGKVDAYQATPLDCSGAVSAVLGINPKVSGQFESFGKPGDGGNRGVTIAANGHHVLMKIDGHWFGTSGSNPGGGAGWIPQSQISPEYLKGFTLRHA